MKFTTKTEIIKTILLAVVLVAGLPYASAWAPATGSSPSGDATRPINTSYDIQHKRGALYLSMASTSAHATGLRVFQTAHLDKIRIIDGNQGDGKVLMSDANGMASWQVPPLSSAGVNLVAEAGYIDCSAAGVMCGVNMSIPFTKTYTTAPAVVLTPRVYDYQNGCRSDSFGFEYKVTGVTATGFTATILGGGGGCGGHGARNFGANWIAVGE